MTTSFDPYHKWLGIPASDQPANHYRLLGVELFEADLDVIDSAAEQRMAFLRTFQSGKNGQHSQKLLNEVAMARITLCDTDRRAAYDAQLRSELEQSAVPTELPPAVLPPTNVPAMPQPGSPINAPSIPVDQPIQNGPQSVGPMNPIEMAHSQPQAALPSAGPSDNFAKPSFSATPNYRRKNKSNIAVIILILFVLGGAVSGIGLGVYLNQGKVDDTSSVAKKDDDDNKDKVVVKMRPGNKTKKRSVDKSRSPNKKNRNKKNTNRPNKKSRSTDDDGKIVDDNGVVIGHRGTPSNNKDDLDKSSNSKTENKSDPGFTGIDKKKSESVDEGSSKSNTKSKVVDNTDTNVEPDRVPEPTDAQMVSVNSVLGAKYKIADFANASREKRSSLSDKFKSDLASETDPKNRFWLMKNLIIQGLKLDRVDQVFNAFEDMKSEFELESEWTYEANLISNMSKSLSHYSKLKPLIENQVFSFVQRASAATEFDLAKQVATNTEEAAARITGSKSSFVKRIQTLMPSIVDRQVAHKDYMDALETVKTESDNPAANGAIGRWLCFVQGDWNTGLDHLVKSDFTEVAKTAKTDAATSPDSDRETILALADEWYAIKVSSDIDQAGILNRSLTWYETIEEGASANVKSRIVQLRAQLNRGKVNSNSTQKMGKNLVFSLVKDKSIKIGGPVVAVAFSRGYNRLFVATRTTVEIWEKGQKMATIDLTDSREEVAPGEILSPSPTGDLVLVTTRRLESTSSNYRNRVYSTATQKLVSDVPQSNPVAVAWLPVDPKAVNSVPIAVSSRTSVYGYRLTDGMSKYFSRSKNYDLKETVLPNCLDITPSGSMFVGTYQGVAWYNGTDKPVPIPVVAPHRLVASENDSILAVAHGLAKSLTIFELKKGKAIYTTDQQRDQFLNLSFMPNSKGRYLLAATLDDIMMIDVRLKTQTKLFSQRIGTPLMAVSPDGKILVTHSEANDELNVFTISAR